MQICTKQLKLLMLPVFLVFVSNIIMIVVAWYLGVERSWIDIDYFAMFLFMAFFKRVWGVVIFAVVATVDFLQLFGQVFPAIRFTDLLYLLKFSWLSSTDYQIYGVLLLLMVAMQAGLIIKLYKSQCQTHLIILFNIFIVIYAVNMNFSDEVTERLPKLFGVIDSQTINYYDYYQQGFIKTFNMTGEVFQPVVVKGGSNILWNSRPKYNKVLLIVNESWGLPNNSDVHTDIVAPLTRQSFVSNISYSQLPMNGFTIAAEMRELCQKALNHFNLKEQTTGFEHCLPAYYKSLGYHTVAVHGALSLMYDRKYWYPRTGFKAMLFQDTGLDLPNSRCYSFPGNCDSDIKERITEQFIQHDRLFLYWLTLNTHATYDNRDLKYDLFDCQKFGITDAKEACRNLKLQKQFFYNLSTMLQSQVFKGTQVIVVGDHEPPIFHDTKIIFKKSTVPFLSFVVQ